MISYGVNSEKLLIFLKNWSIDDITYACSYVLLISNESIYFLNISKKLYFSLVESSWMSLLFRFLRGLKKSWGYTFS